MKELKKETTKGYKILFITADHNSYIGVVADGASKQTGVWSIETLEPWSNFTHLGSLQKKDPEVVTTTRHAIMKHWVTKRLDHEGKSSGAIGYIRVRYYDNDTFTVEVENDPKTVSK